MKKFLALLLCLVMTASLFAACGGNPDTDNTGSANNGEQVTLTIGVPESAMVTDYYENYYTKWLEEKTGYKLEFQRFATAGNDYKTQLSTMVAGNRELPDILINFNLGSDLYERYGKDGVFVDLAPYFNDKEKSAWWWERFELLSEDAQANNWHRLQSGDGEGHIYAFPELQTSEIDSMAYQVFINRDWLDALNLEMPTDMDSLYNVLKAFKEGDPNGNGQPDEIPLIGTRTALSGRTIDWLINMFIYADTSTYFNVDENGKLYCAYTTDQYREALKYVRKLYSEGLLSPLTLTAKAKELRQMTCPSEGNSQLAGVVCSHAVAVFTPEDEGILSYEPMPMWGNCMFKENAHSYTTFITKDCENVDAAWNLLMWMSTEESSIIQLYGIPGEDWDWADEGSKSIMGTEAKIRLNNIVWGTIGNQNWREVEATILFDANDESVQAVDGEPEAIQHRYDLYKELIASYNDQIENYNPPKEQICPLLFWSNEYKAEVPFARDDCREYITKAQTDFITGTMDIESDKDWQAYLDQLNKLGFEQWLFYSQVIYDETVTAQG